MANPDNSGIFAAFGELRAFAVNHTSDSEVSVSAEQVAFAGPAVMKRKVPLAIDGCILPQQMAGEYHLRQAGAMKIYEVCFSYSERLSGAQCDKPICAVETEKRVDVS